LIDAELHEIHPEHWIIARDQCRQQADLVGDLFRQNVKVARTAFHQRLEADIGKWLVAQHKKQWREHVAHALGIEAAVLQRIGHQNVEQRLYVLVRIARVESVVPVCAPHVFLYLVGENAQLVRVHYGRFFVEDV